MNNRITNIVIFLCLLVSTSYGLVLRPTAFYGQRTRTIHICNNTISETGSDVFFGFAGKNVLRCYNQDTVRVIEAHFGIKSPTQCPTTETGKVSTTRPCAETRETTRIVEELCNGKAQCVINMQTNIFPTYCPDEANQALEVTYTCNMRNMRHRPFGSRGFGTQLPINALESTRFGQNFFG